MRSLRDTWMWRGPFGDVAIELHPAAPVDAGAREASRWELRLVDDFKNRQPEARRVVLEIYARMQGLDASTFSRSEAYNFDTGSSRADAIGQELLRAARSGVIVARSRKVRSVVIPLDLPSEDVIGPDSSGDATASSKSWIGLTLVDQTGTPVPNRPYRVIKPDGTTFDGTLDSNGAAMLNGLDPGNCQIWCPYVEPHPETTYAVKDADHVSGVAQRFGFDDYTVVWNDPGNADLQQQRPDPHVLQPGDVLTIPEVKAAATANKPTGAKHPFSINSTPLKVRIKVLDRAAKPMKGAAVTVAGNQLTADGTGLVEASIEKSATSIAMQDPDTTFTLDVGSINPTDDTTDAGYKARLFNLGFLWDPTVADTDDEMVIALQDFQAEYSLTVSGQLDDATKSQLTQTYGS